MTRRSKGDAPTHVALLRGINVGGKNKLPMKELAAMFEDAGCRDVRTYIQSGNVVFRASGAIAARAARSVRAAVAKRIGNEVPVILRTAAELRQAARKNPFAAKGADLQPLHVAFLEDKPSAAQVKALDPDRSPPDELAFHGREVYLRLPNGVARTKITNAYLDRTLATSSTVRNWRTVQKLLEMLDG